MMIIDVQKLNSAHEYSGKLHFTLPADQDLVTIPLVKMVSDMTVDGNYEIFDDDSVEVNGTVRYLLQGACSRCLKPTEKWMEAEWNACFVKGESDGETYSYEKGKIDLTESVKNAVMLDMPYTLLCNENCEGVAYDHQDE